MPVVSFWNPVETSQAATTSSIAAVATMLPAKCKYRTLITQTHYSDFSLESAFFNMDKLGNKGALDIADTGVDALDRLLRSNKLSPESIPNYAKPIYKGERLELLYGTFKNDLDSYSRILETFPIIVDYASQFYDIVFLDLNKGSSNQEIMKILQKSDLIVLTMSQSMINLKKTFKAMDTLKILQEKPIIPVIGKYDRFSDFSDMNIKRVFNYKKGRLYTIPYNTKFFDACNKGELRSFIATNINADPALDRNGFFINETGKLVDAILNNLSSKLIDR